MATIVQAQAQKPLSFEKLSPLYQDVVTITRPPGYHFLWIYSFCIIQDFPQD